MDSIFSDKQLDKFSYAWTGLNLELVQDLLTTKNFFNILEGQTEIELANKGLREIYLMYQPEYLYYTARILLNIELYPIQCAVLEMMWRHPFPMIIGSRGFSKTFLLAVYLLLRAILFPGTNAVVAGSAFRQSKFVYDHVKRLWENSPILQSIFKGGNPYKQLPDIWKFKLDRSELAFIPIGSGEKIRGLRANILAVDEFNSVSLDIYEVVLNQFTAVSMDPIKNMQAIAKRKAMEATGLVVPVEKKLSFFSNQSIISGTMKFNFDPLAIYWYKYKQMIDSQGKNKEDLFGETGDSLKWQDFAIARIPYNMIPEGFMDAKVIERAKATMHADYYMAEFNCIPISDTLGFFKRSLIESCTCKNTNLSKDGWPTWCANPFDARIQGNSKSIHVMGVDPAYNQDNFAIVILEVMPEHSRIVYTWSTSKRSFAKSGEVDEKNYFNFCARKIRNLMKVFNTVGIAIDTQGGGYSIMECLHDPDKMESGEVPLWPIIDPDKQEDTDDYAGSHILTLCQFSSAEWTQNANHGMKKDMEDKVLLFPQFNGMLLGLETERAKDDLANQIGARDSLEDCMLEIEDLKDELCLIVRTKTPAGREHFDTPEIKIGRNKKDRLRKDRYSAILMANSIARNIRRSPSPINYAVVGASKGTTKPKDGKLYYGPSWYDNVSQKCFRGIIR